MQHSIHASPDGGVAVSLLAPVEAQLPSGVTVTVDTEYPFNDDVNVTLSGLTSALPLYIRIPSWATGATLSVNGAAPINVGSANNTMYFVGKVSPAPGGNTATVILHTNPTIRLSGPWYNGAGEGLIHTYSK